MANNSSEYMKDCFADAVIQLLNDYPLKDIPIKQICNLAGYHRASWFRTFRSKSEAVTYHMVRLWQQYCDKHDIAVRDDWSIDNAEAFFQYNYEVRDTTRLLYRRGLMPELAASSTAILTDLTGRRKEVRLTPDGYNQYTLDLTSLPQATYLLTLTTADGRQHTLKLLKQSDIFAK